MNNEDIASRFWNLPQKGAEEARRERLFIDDIIQKSHIQTEIVSRLSGVTSVFDGGAGSGRFSVVLAKLGLRVTHFDISGPMIAQAREYANREGVSDRIEFVKGRLGDLSRFADEQFDMVISTDAPVSYTYPNHEEVIGNLVRLARKQVVISVASRPGSLPYLVNPLPKAQYLLNPEDDDYLVRMFQEDRTVLESFQVDMGKVVQAYDIGLFSDGREEAEAYSRGEAPWPVTYLFLPNELQGILERCGITHVKLAGPGAFSRSIPNEILVRIMKDAEKRAAFLDFCYRFDSERSVAGFGKDNLVASGTKRLEG